MRYATLPAEDVRPNPNQPRKFFDLRSLEELADSIRENGLLQPITVRSMGSHFEVIAGERRFRACRMLELPELPCMVMDGIDDEKSFILATLENVARKDMRPIEEARAYAGIAAMGKTPEEIAQLVGKAVFAITWRLELLNLAPEFQDVDLPMNVARLMSRMSIEGQRSVWHRWIAGEFKTTQEAEKYCNLVVAREAQSGMFAPENLDAFGGDELRRERARVNRNKIAASWQKATAIAACFGPIDDASLNDVADALDGDIDRYLAEVRELEAHVRRARIKFENAKALQKASA